MRGFSLFSPSQFYKKIEAYVANTHLFMMLGGRSVKLSHRGTILEVKSRASVFGGQSASADAAQDAQGSGGEGNKSGGGEGKSENPEEGDDDDDDAEDAEEKARREERENQEARAKKMGREAKHARMRQRMRQNAVVTNFITTLKGDLQKAMADLEGLTDPTSGGAGGKEDGSGGGGNADGSGKDGKEGGSKGKAKGGGGVAPLGKLTGALRVAGSRKKKKSDKDVYGAMADKVKKAIKDLEQQHKQTLLVSKERDKLEEYLTNMLAARDARIPDGNDQGGDDNGNGTGSQGRGGGGNGGGRDGRGGQGLGALPGLGGGGTGSMLGFIDSIGGKPGRAFDL